MGNKLSLNIKKTTAMKIASHRKNCHNIEGDLDLKIRDMTLQTTQDNKYLGVQIHEHLTSKKHIDLISMQVSRATAMLRYVSNILPQSILKNLYTSIVEPHFHYYSSVWGCRGKTEINRLQKSQNRAVWIITSSKSDTPCNPPLLSLGLKSVQEIIDFNTNSMVFKSINGLAACYLSDLCVKNSHSNSRILRDTSTNLRIPMKNTSNGQKRFSYRGVKAWNNLPTKAKQTSSLMQFNKLCCRILLSSYFFIL